MNLEKSCFLFQTEKGRSLLNSPSNLASDCHFFFSGGDDRSYRISCRARGRLRTDGYSGHQKGFKVSKQSSSCESNFNNFNFNYLYREKKDKKIV